MTRKSQKLPHNILNNLINLDTLAYINNGYLLQFRKTIKTVRYHTDLSPYEVNCFLEYANILWNEFSALFNMDDNDIIYIVAYDDPWQKIDSTSCINDISVHTAIETNDIELVRKVFYMALQYQTFPIFVTSNSHLALIPTDHLDLFISQFNQDSQYIPKSSQIERTAWVI